MENQALLSVVCCLLPLHKEKLPENLKNMEKLERFTE